MELLTCRKVFSKWFLGAVYMGSFPKCHSSAWTSAGSRARSECLFSNLFVLDVFTKTSHNLLAYCIENRQSQPVRVSNLRLALDPYLCPHLNPSSYTPIRDGLDILGKKFTRNEKTFNRLRASIIKELTKSVLVSSFSSFE